jgi:hypothetical protein
MRARHFWIAALGLLGFRAAPPVPPGFTITTIALPGSAQRLAAGDLDADGDTDLMVLSRATGAIPLTVLVNGPGHVFAPGWGASLASVTTSQRADLDLGDLDVDGDLDALANIPYAVSQSRLNAGNGTFAHFQPVPTQSPRVQNALGLLDADAVPDLASYDIDLFGYVGGHKGLGNGDFAQQTDEFVGGADFGTQTALGDVTGDGRKDLVRVSNAGLDYTPGLAGAFPSWGANVHVLGSPGFDLALADVDADGRLDVVTSVPASNAIELYRGQAGGLAVGTPFPGGSKPGPLAMADLDGDGFLDVALGSQAQAIVTVNAGSAGGLFFDLARYRAGPNPTDLLATDLDGDGDQDLAEALTDGRVVLLFNKLVP